MVKYLQFNIDVVAYPPISPIHSFPECLKIIIIRISWIPFPFHLVMHLLYKSWRLKHHEVFWEMVEDLSP
jgi:hypothetical protein